jgi:hypothetical protein
MGYPHGRPPEGSRIVDIDSRFAWLKIIHDRNMASKTNGMPIRRGKMISHFNLDLDALLQSWPAIAWFIGIRMLSRVKRKIVGIKK